jgi:ADP-ribose pyrophosphatase YjhB (NUDIX family)
LEVIVSAFAAQGGRVLLVRKNDVWLFPGGKLGPDETYGEGLFRICEEKLPKVDVHIIAHLGSEAGETPFSKQQVLVIVYQCEITGDITPAAEIAEVKWATLFDAFLLKLSPITRQILTQYHPLVSAS